MAEMGREGGLENQWWACAALYCIWMKEGRGRVRWTPNGCRGHGMGWDQQHQWSLNSPCLHQCLCPLLFLLNWWGGGRSGQVRSDGWHLLKGQRFPWDHSLFCLFFNLFWPYFSSFSPLGDLPTSLGHLGRGLPLALGFENLRFLCGFLSSFESRDKGLMIRETKLSRFISYGEAMCLDLANITRIDSKLLFGRISVLELKLHAIVLICY